MALLIEHIKTNWRLCEICHGYTSRKQFDKDSSHFYYEYVLKRYPKDDPREKLSNG